MNKRVLKEWVFRLLGKEPDAIVVSMCAGEAQLCEAMLAEVQSLVPDRRHFAVRLQSDGPLRVEGATLLEVDPTRARQQLRQAFQAYRIGLMPVMWTPGHALCRAALGFAPRKLLVYNTALERHHARLTQPLASWLFLRGVPLDRIYLRPSWLVPWKADRSTWPTRFRELPARGPRAGFRRVAVLTPYSPYPLSHGGAVRMFALLTEAARDFDVYLFWFSQGEEPGPLRDLCAGLFSCDLPRYREPRWATVEPPEAREFWSPALQVDLDRLCRERGVELVQVEYTQLGSFRGNVLVEHDITFDLYRQIYEREPTRGRWWDWRRWVRFEQKAARRFPRVVVMSDKDAKLLPGADTAVIPNGVDLQRFQPLPESDRPELLFVGSFRHFPNIAAFRFFTEEVWRRILAAVPEARLTVVGGPDPLLYWKSHVESPAWPEHPRTEILGFVEDVRPLYERAQVVLVPTTVSAGTNLKVLEAMAMQRAVVSTTSGCAGLGVKHGVQLLIADGAAAFGDAVVALLKDRDFRETVACSGRKHVERHFDWRELGKLQKKLWQDLLP